MTTLYNILNWLIAVGLPLSDLLTSADEITLGGHKQTFRLELCNTTLGQNYFLYKNTTD